jgi:imidazolonepropionase-like amidohydrolase
MWRTIGKLLGALLGASLLLAIALVAWPRSAAPLPDARRGYLIEGVRVVDVVAGTVGPPTSVVVRDGRVAAIGERATGAGLARLDGRGRFLAPGFWDMHAHSFQHSPQVDFPLWIANGVTSVRDMMDCPGERDSLIACVADKRRWNAQGEAGRLAAPRFVAIASYYLEDPSLTPAQVSARAAAYQARGIGALKVYNRLTRPAYFRAAAEARRRGMRLVGHLPKAVPLDEAVDAGQSSFEHAHAFARHCFRRASDWRRGRLDRLPPIAVAEAIVAEHDPAVCRAAFEAIRRAGAWYVPTHVTREEDARAGDPAFVEDPRLRYLDPLSRWAYRDDLSGTRAAYPGEPGERALRAYFEHGLRLTGAAHAAGVQVLVGTDTALGGFRYHDEMAHLARAGLAPGAILRAATIDAARYAGLERTSGTVEVGKRADLVLLDADPLADIGNARRINAVFVNGRLYDRQRLDELLAFARGQAAAPHNWAKLLWGFARSSVTSDL